MYELEWAKPDLLRVMLSGFWQRAEMNAFEQCVKDELCRAPERGGFDMLVDLKNYPPQSAEVAAQQSDVMTYTLSKGMRRSAVVVGNMLIKMQVERVNPWENQRYFTDMADAIAWLES